MDFTIRSEMLLGSACLEKLAHSSVAIFGLGGVGGASVEALARAGVGEFHLIDPDEFNLSNLNRQILSSRKTIGRPKVEVAKERILDINPDAKVFTYPVFYLPDEDGGVDFSRFDYVIDAIDTVTAKVEIIRRCNELGIGIISCMGCGNRLDPSKLAVTDLFKTEGDPLSKVMRQKCRALGIKKLKVVYSTEEPLTPAFKIESDSPTRRDVPGSTPFVPPVAGYLLAKEAVLDLTGFDPKKQ
jgi:tRNA A37 threonylcarbamoyladenosine dehydratase